MNHLKKLLILSIVALVALASCDSDDESMTNDKEKTLAGETSKNWKISAIKGSTKNPTYSSVSIDIFNSLVYVFGQAFPASSYDLPEFPACAKDNIITFKSDKTYSVSEGATNCTDEYELELTEGTWAFTNNNETLRLTDKTGTIFNYDIIKLTDTEMEGENSGEFTYDNTNLDYTIKTTFSAL